GKRVPVRQCLFQFSVECWCGLFLSSLHSSFTLLSLSFFLCLWPFLLLCLNTFYISILLALSFLSAFCKLSVTLSLSLSLCLSLSQWFPIQQKGFLSESPGRVPCC